MKTSARRGLLTVAVALAAAGLYGSAVPVSGSDPATPGSGLQWVPSDLTEPGATGLIVTEKVDLNLATADELARVPGIGGERAQAIVTYRYANGRYMAVDELLNVAGIGEKELSVFRELVTVE